MHNSRGHPNKRKYPVTLTFTLLIEQLCTEFYGVPDLAPGAGDAMGYKTDELPSVMELASSLGDTE